MMNEKSTDGFTLIELLAVVVMVGVLASIAAPGWLAFITNQRLNVVQDEMLQVFQSAQSNARRTNRKYSIDVDSTSGVTLITTRGGSFELEPEQIRARGVSFELGPEQIRDNLVLEGEDSKGDAVTKITFNRKGQLVDINDQPLAGELPIVLTASLDGLNANPQCLVFTTLLGNMVAAEGDACTNPSYDPE